jgi:S1-C subfamily serine protease
MSQKQKLILGCSVLVLVVGCGVLLLVGGLGAWQVWNASRGPGQFEASARVQPVDIQADGSFELHLTINNLDGRPLTIDWIRLPAELVLNANLIASEPAALSQDNQGQLNYALQVAPQGQETLVLTFDGAVSGSYVAFLEVEAGGILQRVPLRLAVAARPHTPTPVSAVTATPFVSPLGVIPFPAVVQIFAMVEVEGGLEIGWSGSGSIISADGLILTNAHVVLPDKHYDVSELQVALTRSENRPPEILYTAEVLQADPQLDIAVIQIDADLRGRPVDRDVLDLPYVPIGDSRLLRLGDALTILGYPGIGGETITLTRGEVSGFTTEPDQSERTYIKTSATIAGGNSGGLVANERGELIGVPTQLGYGGEDEFVDCRVLADTNRDGFVDERDTCVPTGGFINALRPIQLAIPLIEAAQRGEIKIGTLLVPQVEISLQGEVLFEDDFQQPRGWDSGGDEYARRWLDNGEYYIEITPENYFGWANPGLDFEDTVVSVDVRAESTTGQSDFGVLCRYQDDGNFYALEASEDGYYAIWKAVDGEFIDLVSWAYSDLIPQEQAVQVTAACIGDTLSLAVDGELMASAVDSDHSRGDVGLIAGTWEDGDQVMAFDNFIVRAP